MDGIEATKRIRGKEKSSGSHIPIIAMTGKAASEDQEDCLRAGMDTYISKPFRPKELVDVIEGMLQQHKSAPGIAEKSFKILVAEDNKENQEVVAGLLDALDVDYDFAFNGKIALEKLKAQKYDVLLLDMRMPVMDGLKTLEHIRGDEELKDLYVISLTAHAIKGDAQKYIDAGCDDYVSKPIKKEKFRKKINDLLIKKSSGVTSGGPAGGQTFEKV